MPTKSDKPSKKLQSSQPIYTPYTALTLDEDQLINTYGDAARNLFGFSDNDMLGKPIDSILPALSAKFKEMVEKPSSPIRLQEIRMLAKHADGKTFPVSVGMRQDFNQGCCRHLVLVRNLVERPKS